MSFHCDLQDVPVFEEVLSFITLVNSCATGRVNKLGNETTESRTTDSIISNACNI